MVLTKKGLAWAIAVPLALLAGAFIFVYSGAYNIAADEPHWGVTQKILDSVRSRSIQVRARDIQPPNLDDPKLVRIGAGQYVEMCVICHLAPGASNSAIRQGLYPVPPELYRYRRDPRTDFWTIKHGIKMTGMPAWGASHDDATIWALVAFLQRLPTLTPDDYRATVQGAPKDEQMHMPGNGGHAEEPASGQGGHGASEPAHK